MDKKTFENIIYQNWTGYFGCPVKTAKQSGTTLLPESKYDGDKIIALWYIGMHTFVQLDPAYYPRLDQLVKGLPAGTSLTGEQIEAAWGKDALVSRDDELAYYLFPSDLPAYLPAHPFELRQLNEADEAAMSALNAANTQQDVEESFVEVTHQVAFGCFLEKQLVAAASAYERTGFLDIGVLTHPEFRQKGLGKAVVGGLCNWASQHDMIAQYRHHALNTRSQHVARSLNFQAYFKAEGVSLR